MSIMPDLSGSWDFQLYPYSREDAANSSGVLTGSVTVTQTGSGQVSFTIPVFEAEDGSYELEFSGTWSSLPQLSGARAIVQDSPIPTLNLTLISVERQGPTNVGTIPFVMPSTDTLFGAWIPGPMLQILAMARVPATTSG